MGNYTVRGPKSAFFEDATFRGMQSPSHYNPVDTEVYKMRKVQQYKIFKPLTTSSKETTDNSPSPSSYNVAKFR